MKIGILGTRGIPNNYGGFEQFAEYLASYLSDKGWDVYVYNSHNHPYRGNRYKNVSIIHKFDPEYLLGTSGQFIYDLNCIIDSRSREFDIILQLGYTSSSVWAWLHPKKTAIVYNMDGVEWKRSKYGKAVKKFLKKAEGLAVRYADHIIADSPVIADYIMRNYNRSTSFIAYGADIFENPEKEVLHDLNVEAYNYFLVIARLEPENNIETIIRGILDSGTDHPLVIIGNYNNSYGRRLYNKYNSENVRFLGGIYDQIILNNLRYYASKYFHGHSVGGTNPSLIEAMACNTLICAYNNEFNAYILKDNALYFKSSRDIASLICNPITEKELMRIKSANLEEVAEKYTINHIVDQYHNFLIDIKTG